MLSYLLIALACLLATLPMQADQGRLTLVVRDGAGQPLPGVRLGLIRDGDAGRVEVGELVTDRAGSAALPDLPWGLYIVQFRGAAPNGQPIVPPAAQNQGLLTDGAGADGGFGVRFAERERTVLFVIDLLPGTPHAVPLFDLARDPAAPPEPVAPVHPPEDHAPSAAAAPNPPAQRWAVALLGLGLAATGVTLVLGWRRSQAARHDHRSREENR